MATAELALLWFCINWFFWNFSSILIEIRHCFKVLHPTFCIAQFLQKFIHFIWYLHWFFFVIIQIFFSSQSNSMHFLAFFSHIYSMTIKLLRLFCKFVFFSFLNEWFCTKLSSQNWPKQVFWGVVWQHRESPLHTGQWCHCYNLKQRFFNNSWMVN